MLKILSRNFFLFISRQKWICKFVMYNPIGKYCTKMFMAGTSLDDAIKAAYALKKEGKKVILDHLGENVSTKRDVEKAVKTYISILKRLNKEKLDARISIKLTQLGLDIGYGYCLSQVRRVSKEAKKRSIGLEIDMEASKYVSDTLKIYNAIRKTNNNLIVCIQSYLKRSFKDSKKLKKIRLVKGAYNEPKETAFARKVDTNKNYLNILKTKIPNLSIATHDPKIIKKAQTLMKRKGLGKRRVEFQMLYGIQRKLQDELVKEGYTMRIYVPYGEQWCPYIVRRLAERPANVWFAIKGMLS